MKWLIQFFGGDTVLGLAKAAFMTIIETIVLLAKIAIVGAYIEIIRFIGTKSYDLLSSVNILVSGSSNDTVTWALQVVSSMGIWDAFVDTTAIFIPMIVALGVLFLRKILLLPLNVVRDWAKDVTRINYV